MTFSGFDGFKPDKITREVHKSGRTFDLHNDWNLAGCWWNTPGRTFTVEWVDVHEPLHRCVFLFSEVVAVEIRSPENVSTLEMQTLSDLVYQQLEPTKPFIKFWFMDESTITVTAHSLSFEVYATNIPSVATEPHSPAGISGRNR